MSTLVATQSTPMGAPSNICRDYSGIVINQNQVPASINDWFAVTTPTASLPILLNESAPRPTSWIYQEFFLPPNYARGTSPGEQTIPDLSGIQLMVGVDPGYALCASLDYVLQYYYIGSGWQTIASGTTIGAQTDGTQFWFDMIFNSSAPIISALINPSSPTRFRFGVLGRAMYGQAVNQPVTSYDNINAVVLGTLVPAANMPLDTPLPFTLNGSPAFLYRSSTDHQVTYSYQQGVNRIWYSAPNPLANVYNSKAYGADGTTSLKRPSDNAEVSLNFRILGLTADAGTDFLNNTYRSTVVTSSPNRQDTATPGVANLFWLSKPQPSRFAVVSQYFDISSFGQPVVVDGILIDPITPGMYCHIYYSSEPFPTGIDSTLATESAWENKLWTPVHRNYNITKRDQYVLPEPITTMYIKLEFSHLQAKSYYPGNFAKPLSYKKHPKWVLDFFLSQTPDPSFIPGSVGIIYDALSIAYNYVLDDLGQEPEQPVVADASVIGQVSSFLNNLDGQVDADILRKIDLAFHTYEQPTALRGNNNSILGGIAQTQVQQPLDYPIEQTSLIPTDTSVVSSTNRDQVVFEQGFPIMFFFLECRHAYREVTAVLNHNRAYFAGVNEVAFLRHNYSTQSDTALYIESGGDDLNAVRNDFVTDGANMYTY